VDYLKKAKELKAKMDALLATAKAAGRVFSAEEQTSFDAMKLEAENCIKMAAAENNMTDLNKTFTEPANAVEPTRVSINDKKTFATLGENLRAVAQASIPGGKVDPRLVSNAASGLNSGAPAEGGFLVNVDNIKELLKRTYDGSQIAKLARMIPISKEANGLSMNGIDETSRATGSRWGGIRGYWSGEAAEGANASKPKFRQIKLELKKLLGFCYATDDLLSDTTALDSVISQGFSEEFAWLLDDACLNGDGAFKPLGILNSGSLVTVAKATGQAAATIVYENITKMWSRMWARSRQNAVWFINQDCEEQLDTMAMVVGTGGVPVYMPASGAAGQPFATLKGRPVIPVEQCKTCGTVGDIVLADFSQYMLADKGGIQSASSIHVSFLTDEQVFRFTYRVDGQPVWNKALTPANGTNTLSPFVALASRA
jgi:HK97 family phage major capsid protein